MKANQFLNLLCAESLDLENANIVPGDILLARGACSYFNADVQCGDILPNYDYFYWYGKDNSTFGFLPMWDCHFEIQETKEIVYCWKIEN